MSSSPVPSALDARTQAFPVLTTDQISRVRPGSKIRVVKKDEILFELGDQGVPFFVLLTGKLDILQPDLSGERLIVTHGPGAKSCANAISASADHTAISAMFRVRNRATRTG